jgi:hypothetical protein
MEKYFLRIQGIVSKASLRKLASMLDGGVIKEGNCVMFFDYSSYDIPKYATFSYLVEVGESDRVYPIKAKVIRISQEYDLEFDHIPMGHKTIGVVELDAESYDLVKSKIFESDYWGGQKNVVLLSTDDDGFWKKML